MECHVLVNYIANGQNGSKKRINSHLKAVFLKTLRNVNSRSFGACLDDDINAFINSQTVRQLLIQMFGQFQCF